MLHPNHNTLSEAEIIQQAIESFEQDRLQGVFAVESKPTVLEACEAFFMNGFHDDVSGDVETFGHFYRVHRWIVWTDNQGFKDVDTYDTEAEAIKAFEKYNDEFYDIEECF